MDCEGCLDNGTLTGGSITVSPEMVCVGDSLTFTVQGVVDDGGIKRVDCYAKQPIPPAAPQFTWVITKPNSTTLTGSGATAVVVTDEIGVYSCTFTATVPRDCPPAPRVIGPQTGMAIRIRPTSVFFGGPDMRVVAKDDGTGAYPSPHWKDNSVPSDDDNNDMGDHHIPVVYTRNTRMHISATFAVEPPVNLPAPVTIEGLGGGYRFAGTATGGGGTLTISDVQADQLLVNTVEYYDPLTLNWTVTPHNTPPLNCNIAPTEHRVYVTFGVPNAASLYETVVHLGCSNAAGFSSEANVATGVWTDFANRLVRRKPVDGLNKIDGVQMLYWAPPGSANQTMNGMLADPIGNGTCVAWANLHHQVLRAQGILTSQVFEIKSIFPDDPGHGSGDGGMLIKNWSFATVGTAPPGCPPFTHMPTETVDQLGAPAQGNPDPPGGFFNHYIIRYSNAYFDPSCGAGPYQSEIAWENASVDGYHKLCDSVPAPPHAVRKSNETTTLEVVFIPK